MAWSEAWLIVAELLKDPSSHVAAAVSGWAYPMTRDALVVADLRDAFVLAHTPEKRRSAFKPYPRPWTDAPSAARPPVVSDAEVRAALRARGHDI